MSEKSTLFKFCYYDGQPAEKDLLERFSDHDYLHEDSENYDPIKISKLKAAIKKYVKETEYNLEDHLYRDRLFDIVTFGKFSISDNFIHTKALEDAEKRQDIIFAEFEKTVYDIDPPVRD